MRRLAVIGQPIAHSRSPAIHNAAFAELGLTGEWSYEALEVAPTQLAERIRRLPEEGFVGANVTVPHKRAALDLADEASEVARAIGAANTLRFDAGAVVADNTDAAGLLAALPSQVAGVRALVLGAGGAARAAVWALVGSGAEVEIWNRTPARASELASELGATELAEPAGAGDDWRLPAHEHGIVVNATSVGMGAPRTAQAGATLKALRMDADGFSNRQVVVDLAYGPDETELVRTARAEGATVIDGLEVLVRQGAESFRIWTGLEPPLEAMRQAARSGWPQRNAPHT